MENQVKFHWGAATSSHQIEGNNIFNDWWAWEQSGRIENKATSGQGTDHWNRYREDLDLAQKLGLTSYRFSIEWSRLQPTEDSWNEDALDWYDNLVDECWARRIEPMVTLHHFTVPQWFAEKGGFTWNCAPEVFAEYVERVVRRIGPKVRLWCTINEPMTWVVGQYLGGYMPPAQYDPEKVSTASRNLFLSHLHAYDTIHEMAKHQSTKPAVGIAHNMVDFLPLHEWHPLESWMVKIFRRFYNRAWLDAVTGMEQHFGLQGFIPYANQVKEGLGRKSCDFIGINYYTKCYLSWHFWGIVREPGAVMGAHEGLPLGMRFAEKGDLCSDLGWAVHPAGLGRMIRFTRRYGLPLYITENGIADHRDSLRGYFLLEHLQEVAKEIEEGADIRGYYHWSLLDNFEWVKGFGPRFGLIAVNYEDFSRSLRPSALLYKDIIRAHLDDSDGVPKVSSLQDFNWIREGIRAP